MHHFCIIYVLNVGNLQLSTSLLDMSHSLLHHYYPVKFEDKSPSLWHTNSTQPQHAQKKKLDIFCKWGQIETKGW